MKRALILINYSGGMYATRRELVERLIESGYEVFLSCPVGERIKDLVCMGCRHIETKMDRHGVNPFSEIKLFLQYRRIICEIRPDVVLTYTIKPNIYGGMAAATMKIPQIANITGLGSAVENAGPLQKLTLLLYRIGLRKAKMIFFQNESNMQFLKEHRAVSNNYDILPGSGVNLDQHCFEPYPEDEGQLVFLTIGRIMREKGTDELLAAARDIKKESPQVTFRLIGFFDGEYQDKVEKAIQDGIVEHLGYQPDVHMFIKQSHAIIHAAYHEGMSNVLLEAAACGRPVIATDVPGCRETFDDEISGLSCKVRDAENLARAIRTFIELPYEQKVEMGKVGRQKMEKEFDRRLVVEAYMREIEKVMEGKAEKAL